MISIMRLVSGAENGQAYLWDINQTEGNGKYEQIYEYEINDYNPPAAFFSFKYKKVLELFSDNKR